MMTDLVKYYEEHLRDWNAKLLTDEWYFARLRSSITKGLSSKEAFHLIPQALSLTMLQNDSVLCIETFELLMDLVRISDTTEMPQEIELQWDNLLNHVRSFGNYHRRRIDEITKWYRKN